MEGQQLQFNFEQCSHEQMEFVTDHQVSCVDIFKCVVCGHERWVHNDALSG